MKDEGHDPLYTHCERRVSDSFMYVLRMKRVKIKRSFLCKIIIFNKTLRLKKRNVTRKRNREDNREREREREKERERRKMLTGP